MHHESPELPDDAVHPHAPKLLARQLVRNVPTVRVDVTANRILGMFHDDTTLNALAVLDEASRIIGVLRAQHILRRGTEFFFHEPLSSS